MQYLLKIRQYFLMLLIAVWLKEENSYVEFQFDF